MTKQFRVYRKYNYNAGRARVNKNIPDLGGLGCFVNRFNFSRKKNGNDWFKLKVFVTVHLHGEHDTPIGRHYASWSRASRILHQHMPKFNFQRDIY